MNDIVLKKCHLKKFFLVNGKWTLWSSWDTCDASCGGGVQTRERTCKKSSHTDIDCVGDTIQEQSCNDWLCPGMLLIEHHILFISKPQSLV